MDEEAEIKEIKKWLRIVDKPLETNEEDKRGGQQGRGGKRRKRQSKK